MSKQQWKSIWDWTKAMVIAIVAALLIRQFVFTFFIVQGPSMNNTLWTGERVLVDRFVYDFSKPKINEIIVFHATPTDDYIKRVEGLPGDVIQVKDGHLYRNGQEITEPYIAEPMLADAPFGPFKVPAGDIFAMGDNRNVSKDSREIGPIPINKIVGRADAIVFPFGDFRLLTH